ncbi:FecR domain-containing protein [Sphingomonas sp. AOB5]|uniref:FecR family protein n=1 Tax=Sphingomonas sp. AOB5 TaxID=3034017 RepID=UPI0023F74EC9|nr:FecR family protein [Sphingomonas sp. AOB5]MDF7776407.1 FecR domain-containing protein [Sphingomonas sp. AOB5]
MAHRSLLTLLLAGTAVIATPAAAQNVGVTSAVVNDVRMTTDANRVPHKAVLRERVSLGNDIMTGKASRLQVLLLDRTTFTVGSNARIKVDRFVYDPNRKSSSVGVTVTRGAFRFMSGRPTHNAPGTSNIRTPTASIGIRGTIVEGVVGEDAIAIAAAQPGLPPYTADPETATLILLRGPGAAAQGGETAGAIDVTAGGATVPIESPGYAVFIPADGQPPIGPFLLSPVGSTMLTDLLRNPNYPLQQMANPAPTNPVTGRNGEFGTSVRQLPGGQNDTIRPPIQTTPTPTPGQGGPQQPGSPIFVPPAGGTPTPPRI